ncbi:hypothetical protein ACIQBJ_13645 [Kitasatospora sp. NPDC088391]|uniref:hypothetical protein n=1 Tax=Kitasatospora sp. NPDC088391 TaxID=3364074 RepID=UPI003829C5F0
MTDERLLAWALRLHPAPYRRQHGPELAEAARASMADRPRAGVLAEAAHLAAHGLRLRLGLGADRPTGRAAAGAAPLVLTVALAGGTGLLLRQRWDLGHQLLPPDGPLLTGGDRLVGAGLALTALALLALLLGRVTATRLLATAAAGAAAAATVLSAHSWVGAGASHLLGTLGGPLAVCLFLWLAPLSLTERPDRRTAALSVAGGLGVAAVVGAVPGLLDTLVLDAAMLLAAGLGLRRTGRPALVGLLALLPLLPRALGPVTLFASYAQHSLLAGALAAAVAAVLLRLPARTPTAPAAPAVPTADED